MTEVITGWEADPSDLPAPTQKPVPWQHLIDVDDCLGIAAHGTGPNRQVYVNMSGTLRTGERIKLDIKLRQDQIRDWAESFTKLANDLTPGDPNWFTQS